MDFRGELAKVLYSNDEVTDSDLENYISDVIALNADKLPILYRFSPADYNNIRALETNTLYLSEIGSMNDVFEGLSCNIDDPIIENIQKLTDLAYLKSFTETKDDLKMWSMYADNYAGMCIAYDFRNNNCDFMYHLFPVCYSEKRKTKIHLEDAVFELAKFKRDIEDCLVTDECDAIRDIMSLFLVKSPEWENEREWRIVVTYPQMNLLPDNLPNAESRFFYELKDRTISVPFATDVYLGPKMPMRVKNHIKEIANRNNIRVHELKLDKGRYALIED